MDLFTPWYLPDFSPCSSAFFFFHSIPSPPLHWIYRKQLFHIPSAAHSALGTLTSTFHLPTFTSLQGALFTTFHFIFTRRYLPLKNPHDSTPFTHQLSVTTAMTAQTTAQLIFKLVFCVAGIYGAYITQGFFQETLSTRRFGADKARFPHLATMNAFQSWACFLWAFLLLQLQKAFSPSQ